VTLTGDRVVPQALRESIVTTVDGDRAVLEFPDGERVEVVLGAEPACVRHPARRCAGPRLDTARRGPRSFR
jgi:hypothetical protein